MNKISKKIVSLVTMAAFALTLVPAAAFAVPTDDIHATVTPTSDTELLLTDDSVSIDFDVTIGEDWNKTYGATGQLAFWYGSADAAQSGVTFSSEQAGFMDASNYTGGDWANTNWFPANLTDGGHSSITATFTAAGTYDLYAGSWTTGQGLGSMAAVKKIATITVRTTDADAGNSRLLIDGDTAAVSVAQNTPQEFEFNVRTADNHESEYALANDGETVYVWAENSKGEIVSDVTFAAVDSKNTVAKSGNQGLWTVSGPVTDGTKLTATFANAGDGYTLNATTAENVPQITGRKVTPSDNDLNEITVNVTAAAVKTETISFVNPDSTDVAVAGPDSEGNYTYTINDNVTPSGVKVYTVKGVAKTEDGVAAQGEVLKVTAKRGVTLDGLSDEGTVTTNARGEFEFTFTISDNGEFDIDVAEVNGDASATLTVIADEFYVGNIKTVEDGGYLLAGNDTKYANNFVGTSSYFADAVQFALTDVNGNEVTNKTFGKNTYTLSVTAPEGSKLKADDLSLVWDQANGVYTLAYNDTDNTGKAADLIPGEYTVKIAFKSSDTAATATFNLAKFGTVQDIALDLIAGPAGWNSSSDDSISAIDDQVALGQSVKVVPYYVDENGIKVSADYSDLAIGINGSAVKDNYYWLNGALYFDTFDNIPANESLVGTTITIKVFDEENGKYVEKELTVVKNYLNETLSFDPTSGVVGEDNKVTVSVVDEDGNLSKVNGTLHAYVADQSNDDAYVEVDVKNANVKNGKGELTLYSDAEGTADVVVVVTASNGEMYGATLNYTFGKEDPNALNTVVMTIGSTEYVVNNDVVTGDAAPYVDSNWRTMVPFRVLGETFGATVNWDEDAQTVTYTLGDTEIVMTIGEDTYTVNGEEQTMDTAPVIQNNRTMVPVRFVAEALGYEVTPLENAAGLTASVVFQK